METLLFVAVIAGVVAVAVAVARRPGRPAVRRRYDYDVGPGTELHGDGGPTPGADFGGGHGGGGDSGGGGGS